jgi:DNA invertase Pin-like site-specific DNA recombinase
MDAIANKIRYARVSTLDQDLELQVAALKAAGCNIIRFEKRSGTSTAGRDELRAILDFIHPGDTLVVTRIDRLARGCEPRRRRAGGDLKCRLPLPGRGRQSVK